MPGIVIANNTTNRWGPVIDSNNTLWIAYSKYAKIENNNYNNIFVSHSSDGINWIEEQITSIMYAQNYPILLVDSQDILHLFWSGKGWGNNLDTENIQYKKRTVDGWQEQERITDEILHQEWCMATIDDRDVIHVIWHQIDWDDNIIFPHISTPKYIKNILGTWSEIEVIAICPEDRNYYIECIKVDNYGTLHCFGYSEYDNDNWYSRVIYVKKDLNGWSQIQYLSGDSQINYPYSVAIDSSNNLYVTVANYQITDGRADILLFEYKNNNLEDIPLELYSDFNKRSPMVNIDLNDNIYLVWLENGHGLDPYVYQVFYRKKSLDGWSDIIQITNSSSNQFGPHFNSGHIIWRDNNSNLHYTYLHFNEGQGTSENPFVITNIDQLQAIDFWYDRHFILGNDIDASDTINWNNGEGFRPICYEHDAFTGTLNGKGYNVKNLYINRSNKQFQSLIYYSENASISNLGIKNLDLTGAGGDGGIASVIVDSSIEECYVIGRIVTRDSTGGILSLADNSIVSKCYFEGEIISINDGFCNGGIVSYIGRSSIVTDCYSNSIIEGYDAGGIVSESYNSSIQRCYSNSYSNDEDYEGICNYTNSSNVENSYYNYDIIQNPYNGKGGPLTTEQMKDKTNYIGWDFDTVWKMDNDINNSYPILRSLDYIVDPPIDIYVDDSKPLRDETYVFRVGKIIDDGLPIWSNEASIFYGSSSGRRKILNISNYSKIMGVKPSKIMGIS